ncbi:BN6_48550 family protein, partial [Micromonospora sp. CPCC 205371]|nr:BN6_48550 family protein [Micromonospora sp. CPCC 205371]
MTPHRPGLIVHTFLPADPWPTTAIRSLWQAVTALGMAEPIGRWPTDPRDGCAAATADPMNRRMDLLAARQRLEPGTLYQAIVYRVHDVVGVSVHIAPNDDRLAWDRLLPLWTGVAPAPPDGALGSVTIYTALVPADRRWYGGRADPAAGPPESLARRLGAGLPDPVSDWAAAWCRTSRDLLAWELPGEDTLTHRRLLAVTGAHNEPALDRWTWAGDGPGLPPLTRYLLHAAKLRYQHQVLRTNLPALRASIARAEHGCGVLDKLLRTPEPPLRQLLEADRALSTAQTDQSGLIAALSDVRDMARTAAVAERNMAAALGTATRSTPEGPPALDRDLGAWLREQLRTEETYLDSAHRRVREVGRLAGTTIDQRQRQRLESLTLLQTSVLGALLMALAAIQSLEYKTPLPGPLLAPLIWVLGTVALLLPAAVLRWPGGPAAGPHGRWSDAARGG